MIANHGKRILTAFQILRPGVMKIQSGAVIDEPQLPMPDQHVGVARRAIDVGDERVEPDDLRRQLRVGLKHHRIEGDGTGQIVERHVEPGAGANQVLDLDIGLGARQIRIELDQHDLRDGQAGGAADLACHQLGDQCFRPLAGTPPFDDIHAFVIGFDDGGYGAAFAQRSDIAGDDDGSQAVAIHTAFGGRSI